MKKLNIIVPCCGYAARMDEHTDTVPKSLLMLGNKTIVLRQLEYYREMFSDYDVVIHLVLPSSQISRVAAYLEVNEISNINLITGTLGAGSKEAVRRAVEAVKLTGPCVLNWSDVLLTSQLNVNFASSETIVVTHGESSTYRIEANKIFVDPNVNKGNVVGVYVVKAIETLNLAGVATDDFIEHLGSHVTDKPVECIDIGNKVDYERAASKFTLSRDFNRIDFEGDKVVKTALTKHGRLLQKAEVEWYHFTNDFFHAKLLSSDKDSMTLEYIDETLLRDVKRDDRLFKVRKLLSFVKAYKDSHGTLSVTNEQALADVESEARTKLFDRDEQIRPLLNAFSFESISPVEAAEVSKIFDRLADIVKLKYEQPGSTSYRAFHGDINFSNCFVNAKTDTFKLIDPRAFFGTTEMFGPDEYELAKIAYACSGYDNFVTAIKTEFNRVDGEIAVNVEEYLPDYYSLFADNVLAWVPIIWRNLAAYLKNDPQKALAAYYHSVTLAKRFLKYYDSKQTVVIDFDDTICEWDANRDYAKFKPKWDVIDAINRRYDNGDKIIIHTARGVKSNADESLIDSEMYSQIYDYLKQHKVKFHKLLMGKPYGDEYIDDKSVSLNNFVNENMCLNFVCKDFETAFVELNRAAVAHGVVEQTRIGPAHECYAMSFKVDNVERYVFRNKKINRIDYKYAEAFYDFMMTGKNEVSNEFDEYESVKQFTEKPKSANLPDNFNTFYGPRILRQIDCVVNELKDHPTSRRAVIHILNEDDNCLLVKDTKLEYACTLDMVYYIRQGKLNCHCNMRSQNLAVVLQLDMYVQARLLIEIAKRLDVPTGVYSSTMVNAHVFERDLCYVASWT